MSTTNVHILAREIFGWLNATQKWNQGEVELHVFVEI